MIHFFFYHHLLDEILVRKLSNDFYYQNGTIYIESFDSSNDKLILGNKNIPLEGKLFTFDSLSLNHILEKMSVIYEIKYKNKLKYILDEIDVHSQQGIIRAYIIY